MFSNLQDRFKGIFNFNSPPSTPQQQVPVVDHKNAIAQSENTKQNTTISSSVQN
jgi:hypothetical protein